LAAFALAAGKYYRAICVSGIGLIMINTTETVLQKRFSNEWSVSLLLWLLTIAGIVFVFWDTCASLFYIWNNNVSYQYCFLILPIIGWLIYERRKELVQLTPRPSFWGVAAFTGAALIWLLGEAGDVNLVRHAALIFMLQSTILAVFGFEILRATLFPTIFAAFMIPAGEQFVAPLQKVTAWFCVKLLDLFNIPFTTDGLFIHVPNGTFEVAEACSGIRYLTTMVALGAVYANLSFKSTLRRAIVMIMAVVFPVVANGIRAWGIIALAYVSDNTIATGIDHILYGWVFFVLVMLLFMAACWRFSDRPVTMVAIDLATFKHSNTPAPRRNWAVTCIGLVIIMFGVLDYADVMRTRPATLQSPTLALGVITGWDASDHADRINYLPIYKNASAEKIQLLSDGEGRFIQLYMAVYDRQSEDREMVAYGNGVFQNATDGNDDWVWTDNMSPPPLKYAPAPSAMTIYKHETVRDVWQWFYVNGKVITSPSAAKLEAAKARLLGGRSDAATLILSTERVQTKASNALHLQKFAEALGPVDSVFKTWITSGAAPTGTK
jgi:exosortase A